MNEGLHYVPGQKVDWNSFFREYRANPENRSETWQSFFVQSLGVLISMQELLPSGDDTLDVSLISDDISDLESQLSLFRPILLVDRNREALNDLDSISAVLNEVKTLAASVRSSEKTDLGGSERYGQIAEPAVRFFDSGLVAESLVGYEGRDWEKAPPEKLAVAIMSYVRKKMDDQAVKNQLFINISIFGATIPGPDNPTLATLIESYGHLGKVLYPNDSEMQKKFKAIEGKVSVDWARIERIYRWGKGVHELEGNYDAMVDFFNTSENAMNGEELQRMFEIGDGYEDKEGFMPIGSKNFWGCQAWLLMYDPLPVPGNMGVYNNTDDGKPTFVGNLQEKNPLTVYPESIEGGAGDARGLDAMVKRLFLRKILGGLKQGDVPPWVKEVKVDRQPGETLSQLANRRHRAWNKWLIKAIYGTPKPQKQKGIFWGEPGSFFEKARQDLGGDPNAFDEGEQKEIQDGFFNEFEAQNLMEYWLMPPKAEAPKVTGDRFGNKIKEVNHRSGPTGKFYAARPMRPQMYTNKLVSEGGGDGTHGPIVTKDVWYSFVQSYLDRYWYIPGGEREGITLREAMLALNSPEEFKTIPFTESVITTPPGVDAQMPWQDMLGLSKLWTKLNFGGGSGISWHNIVKQLHTGETIFAPEMADYIKGKLSRNAYYMLTRDWGRVVASWPDKASYERFRRVEDYFFSQFNVNRKVPPKPDQVGNVVVTNELWEQVLNYSKRPTSRHFIIDGRPFDDMGGQGVLRLTTNIYDAMRVPTKERDMNPFEKQVLKVENNDPILAIRKLIVGNWMIGDLFRDESSRSMDSKDLIAFFRLFSHRYHEQMEGGPVLRAIRRTFEGKKQDDVYNGLGYFTTGEVAAMLEEAGVGTGFGAWWRGIIAEAQKIGA